MRSFDISEEADQDLLGIWNYSFKNWGIEQADHYLDLIEAGCQKIGDGSAVTRSLKKIHRKLKSSHCEHHYIFYLSNPGQKPLVIAVLHENMDLIARVKKRL